MYYSRGWDFAMYESVLLYAQQVGFPNTHFYGNDGEGNPIGLVYGAYAGPATVLAGMTATLAYAKEQGFADADNGEGDDGAILAFNVPD